jgi:uncharacterized protein YaaN involved in tellurite resistance
MGKIFDEYREHLKTDISGYQSYDDYVDERIAKLELESRALVHDNSRLHDINSRLINEEEENGKSA